TGLHVFAHGFDLLLQQFNHVVGRSHAEGRRRTLGARARPGARAVAYAVMLGLATSRPLRIRIRHGRGSFCWGRGPGPTVPVGRVRLLEAGIPAVSSCSCTLGQWRLLAGSMCAGPSKIDVAT